MQKFLLLLIFLTITTYAQSPHGNNFKLECSICHKEDDKPIVFDHLSTGFIISGAHLNASCINCHNSLEFDKVKKECYDCHIDIHQGSLDKNCNTCHNSNTWIIENINNLHRGSRFRLLGAHQSADCIECHTNNNQFKYDVLGVGCYDCHKNDYVNAKSPNHITENYPVNCYECHRVESSSWKSNITDHSFFPLLNAHNISNCFDCHTDSKYSGLDKNCITCHSEEFNSTLNPNHLNLGFNKNECAECHSLNPGWIPARFEKHSQFYPLSGAHSNLGCNVCHKNNYNGSIPNTCFGCHENEYNSTTNPPHLALNFSNDCTTCHNEVDWNSGKFYHDADYFPIYSGLHDGVWNSCNDCHTNQTNYQNAECITCHEHNKADTDLKHLNINGYRYQSIGCIDCHPDGRSNGAYNHALSGFLLTGAHIETSCNLCHNQSPTLNTCYGCHSVNFNSSSNPNHISLGFNTDCEKCHTTERGWQISQFSEHDNFYTFQGAHINIKNNCILCHNGNYTNTSSECSYCHLDNYNSTTNPPHQGLNFNTKCDECHNQNAWQPATFNHDAEYFPIFTGSHSDKWDNCTDCHTVNGNYSAFSCIDCHAHNNEITDDFHIGVQGYIYSSRECVVCHPTGVSLGSFNHANAFPLIGAHNNTTCNKCHTENTYILNKTECKDCHFDAYNGALMPNHINYGFSYECSECHNTEYGWKVYKFDKHDEYYPLIGKHKLVATNCQSCHPENYQTAPTQCYSCHYTDYVNTSSPNHILVGFSNDCAVCHTPNGWSPSTFAHDTQYFPIYIGEHAGSWESCETCHTTPNILSQFSCITCHNHSLPDMQNRHIGVSGFTYESDACYACHPAGTGAGAFNHSNSSLPLLGVHATVECNDCHTNGYSSLSNICYDCHQNDYQNSVNPNHSVLSIPQDCSMCHTPEPRWNSNIFPIHNNYYPLIGAHSYSSLTCYSCHQDDYNNTPKTCVGCHLSDYNNAQNPSHLSANFPMECEICHNQNAWIPALFEHDGQYFPIFSGTHQSVWNDCSDCHIASGNYQVFECINCHYHNQSAMDLAHANVTGYYYKSPDCYSCHPNGKANKFLIKKNNLRD